MKRPNVERARGLRRNQTDAGRKLWSLLRNRRVSSVNFRRQFPVDKYILDFYSPEIRLCVECDGGKHYERAGKEHDDLRTMRLNELGIRVVRFSDRDILLNIGAVGEAIHHAIHDAGNAPHLSPLPGGERKL